MKRLLLTSAALIVLASPVMAAVIDPLHIECSGCSDNGTNTPLPSSTSQFGFSSSPPGQTGTLFLEVLVPDTTPVGAAPTVAALTAGFSGGPTALVSATPWTTGTLNGYLGGNGFSNLNLNPSPDNGIGAYLPSTAALVPGANGFDVFLINVGATPSGLTGPGVFPTDDQFQLGGNLPVGSYVIAMLAQNGDVVNTANSGAGFVNTTSVGAVPELSTWAMMLLGFFSIGLAGLRNRGFRFA